MTLLEDLKNLPETLKAYDIIAKVSGLESKIKAIESWKNESAIPQFNELYNKTVLATNQAIDAGNKAQVAAQEAINASNIANTAKTDITNIKTWINNEAIPNINTALTNAQTAAQQALNASNIAKAAQDATVDIQNWINDTAIPNINTALADAKNAAVNAQQALTDAAKAAAEAVNASELAQSVRNAVETMAIEVENAKNKIFQIRDVFVRIGNKIRTRIDNIQRLISELYNLIVNGMYSINNNAVYTANRIKQWGEIIVSNGEYIFAQSQDAINEINVPLGRVEHYAKILADPNIFDLPWTFFNIYMAFAHTVFLSYGNEGSVIQEIKEGFNQTFSAVRDFGMDLENAFKDWMNNFKILFADMKDQFNAIASKMTELNQEILGLFNDIQIEITTLG